MRLMFTVLLIIFTTPVFSERLVTDHMAEEILTRGKIINSTGAKDFAGTNNDDYGITSNTTYHVIYQEKFYICSVGVNSEMLLYILCFQLEDIPE